MKLIPTFSICVAALVATFLFSSCGTINKALHKHRVDTSTHIDSSGEKDTHIDSSGTKIDKSVTIIEERGVDSVKTKADSLSLSVGVDTADWSTGGIFADNGGIAVRVTFDPKKKKVNIKAIKKPEIIPTLVTKVTTVHSDVTEHSQVNKAETEKARVKVDSTRSELDKTKDVHRKGFNLAGAFAIIGIFIVIIAFIYFWIWRKKKKIVTDVVDKIT